VEAFVQLIQCINLVYKLRTKASKKGRNEQPKNHNHPHPNQNFLSNNIKPSYNTKQHHNPKIIKAIRIIKTKKNQTITHKLTQKEEERNRTRENDLVLQSPFSSDPTDLVSLFKIWVPDLKRAYKKNKV
jgi:hypothetical protein